MIRRVAQWGQRIAVPEPAIGTTPRRVDLVSITEEEVRVMAAQGQVPAVRDWTIYARADGQTTARVAAPRADVIVRYGSGASSYERTQRIPVVGCVLHVVATWLDVSIVLSDSTLPPVGDVQLEAVAAPGRPSRGLIPDHAFFGIDPTPIRTIPPFAIGWLGVRTDAGQSLELPAFWRYQGINRAPVAPATGIQVIDARDTMHLIPRDADSIAMFPGPPDPINLHWWWDVWS